MHIYVSSKLKHRTKWTDLAKKGIKFSSSWIKGKKVEGHQALQLMWRDYRDDLISRTEHLVLYVEPGEVLKGGLIEVGMAMGQGNIPIVIVWGGELTDLEDQVGTWIHHDMVTITDSLEDAMEPLNPDYMVESYAFTRPKR